MNTLPPESLDAAIGRVGNAVDLLRNMQGRPFSHGTVPAQFTHWQSEVNAWRTTCAFMDQSPHMIDLHVKGPDAHRLLAWLGTNSFAGFWRGVRRPIKWNI